MSESTIRKELQRLLGPRYFWYHVSSKFPQKILENAGEQKAEWKALRETWPQSSRERVEVRLRCVKDSQATLADILQSDQKPNKPEQDVLRPFYTVEVARSQSHKSLSTVTRDASPAPTLTDQSTVSTPATSIPIDEVPSLYLTEALASSSARRKRIRTSLKTESITHDAILRYEQDDEDADDLLRPWAPSMVVLRRKIHRKKL